MNTIFPLRLFGSIPYYAAMSRSSCIAFDTGARYNKSHKDTHRFAIADTRGRLALTVPVSHGPEPRTWHDITVSDHGRWWETMPIALESAYGRTPYFEFYIDRLMPLFRPDPVSVVDLCLSADAQLRRMLYIDTEVVSESGDDFIRYREERVQIPLYWQLRADKLGFIDSLSVLDLLFNLGPEAAVYLRQLSTSLVDKR